ncbi:MAG TPA: hypothetical protein VE344_11925 [Methylomirabilota bacterium]|nr:hypothetical protein [Methylomirabilota bacterium]
MKPPTASIVTSGFGFPIFPAASVSDLRNEFSEPVNLSTIKICMTPKKATRPIPLITPQKLP